MNPALQFHSESNAAMAARLEVETRESAFRRQLMDLGWTPPGPVSKLAAFGGLVLKAHREDGGCDIDGGELQRMAAAAGALEERVVTKSCGEGCACAYMDEFPTKCFFIPADVADLIKD